jgi:hypothetical protein
MPANREILALLTRDELLIALDFYELTVPDRRVKDDIVEALATSRKIRSSRTTDELRNPVRSRHRERASRFC